jgi:bifunctional N-acetylglucosamine-1-phosphate-uridyltransferase/glucosamine-1-phosphate-acetyltransferase GlmU-like protein
LLIAAGRKAKAVIGPDYRELLGINTVAQLQEAERIHADIQRAARLREEC